MRRLYRPEAQLGERVVRRFCLFQLFRFTLRTKLRWVPNPRCKPEQLKQTKTPHEADAQLGLGAVQSAHSLLPGSLRRASTFLRTAMGAFFVSRRRRLN